MKKCLYSFDDLKMGLKTIIKQIKFSSYEPELIISINRGGCIAGVYLSHYLKLPHEVISIQFRDGDGYNDFDLNKHIKNKKSVLIVDDINDTGKTFGEIKKSMKHINCDVKYCALLDNTQSSQKIDFHGKLINKSIYPIWYIFPWENWW